MKVFALRITLGIDALSSRDGEVRWEREGMQLLEPRAQRRHVRELHPAPEAEDVSSTLRGLKYIRSKQSRNHPTVN